MSVPPEPLEYRDWREDAPKRKRTAGQFAAGFVCGVGAVFFSGCNFVLTNIYYNPRPRSFQTDVFNWRGPAVVAAVVLTLLGGIMLFARARGKRPFVAGALVGVGLMALIDGICFYNSWK